MPREATNQSVERAFALVDALARDDALTLTELAREAALSLSTASRLVGTLEQLNVIRRDARTGLLSLASRSVLYGAAALNATPLYRAARQVAQDLAADLGLGANVAHLVGGKVTYLLNVEGKLAPRHISLSGRIQPAHATGLGKALISEFSEASISRLIDSEPLQPFTAFTITTGSALREALELVRRQGYATEIEELAFGRACIAAPIRASGGSISGAISVSGPLGVMDLEHRTAELSRIVLDSAAAVGAALDYDPAERLPLPA